MTETSTPPTDTMSMSEVWAMVEVTPGDAIALLNALAEANSDRSPTLVASLNAAIENVATGGKKEEEETSSTEPTTTY